jgi:hypothetical protein
MIFLEAKLLALRQTPNLEDQVPVFMSHSNKMVQFYPQSPGSLFVAFYYSHENSAGIPTRLRAGTSRIIIYGSTVLCWTLAAFPVS